MHLIERIRGSHKSVIVLPALLLLLTGALAGCGGDDDHADDTHLFHLHILVEGDGVVHPSDEYYTPGTEVLIEVGPGPDFEFVRWEGEGAPYIEPAENGEGEPAFFKTVMDQDVWATAVFELKERGDEDDNGDDPREPDEPQGPPRPLLFDFGDAELLINAEEPLAVSRRAPTALVRASDMMGLSGPMGNGSTGEGDDGDNGTSDGDDNGDDGGADGDDNGTPDGDEGGDNGDENGDGGEGTEPGEDGEVMSNLIGLDRDGNTWAVVHSEYGPVEIDLVVNSPDAEHLYIVLGDLSVELYDALDECRFFRVPVDQPESGDDFICVSEHWTPVFGHGGYGQRLSGVRKPIYFDGEGRLFFMANRWPHGHDNALLRLDPMGEDEVPSGTPEDLVSPLGRLTRITDSAQNPSDFLVTHTGVPVWSGQTQAGGGWFLKAGLPGGGEVTLVSSEVAFYGADSYDAILWAPPHGDPCRGIRFARARPEGGFERRCYSTHRFYKDQLNNWPKPRSLVLANDGYYYALIELDHELMEGTQLFRVLPPNPEPIVTLEPAARNVQISHQHIFFIVEVSDPNFGLTSAIKAVNVNNRQERHLFTGRRIELYSFKIVGDTMYVVGRDLEKQAPLVAEVRMGGLMRNEPEEDIVTETTVQDAALEAQNIRDMAVVRPQVPDAPVGVDPRLMEVYFDQDEPQTATLSFSVPVDESTVESSVSVVGEGEAEVPLFGIWGFANLHLLMGEPEDPSTSMGGALEWGEAYGLKLDDGAFDRWDNPISVVTSALLPRPAFGFSVKRADDMTFGHPPTLRYVRDPDIYTLWGPTEELPWYKLVDFAAPMSDDVAGVEIIAHVRSYVPHLAAHRHEQVGVDGFAFNLQFPAPPHCYADLHGPDCDFPFHIHRLPVPIGFDNGGLWARYNSAVYVTEILNRPMAQYLVKREFERVRARRFGTRLIVETVEEGSEPGEEVLTTVWDRDAAIDTALREYPPRLLMRAGGSVEFRHLEIWALDEDGARLGAEPRFLFDSGAANVLPRWGQDLMDALDVIPYSEQMSDHIDL